MAYEFLKSLHQASLEKEFNTRAAKPAVDPMPKRRESVSASADKALAALKEGLDNGPQGLYRTKANTDVVACRVKYGTRNLNLGGTDVFYTKDAVAFFKGIKEAVKKGELDTAINAALEGKGNAGRQRGQRSTAGTKWTPEQCYNRNIKKYGQARADELLNQKHGADADAIRKRATAS